jgi:hypothetical protein
MILCKAADCEEASTRLVIKLTDYLSVTIEHGAVTEREIVPLHCLSAPAPNNTDAVLVDRRGISLVILQF